ncbi:MAG: DJ-1/PfpI family protein [Bacteroidota bacterium]
MNIAVLLFEDFETLDVYGPVEIFGRLTDLYTIRFYSLNGGLIKNKHGIVTLTEKFENDNAIEIFLIPGGIGTRIVVDNKSLIDLIRETAERSHYVLTVCTGSALLAKTGLLDGKRATSNKRAFSWAITNGPHVYWDKKARWTMDGKYYTSSGVSAGMDMALGFLSDRQGIEFARTAAKEIEYHWNDNKDDDSFKLE